MHAQHVLGRGTKMITLASASPVTLAAVNVLGQDPRTALFVLKGVFFTLELVYHLLHCHSSL